MSASAVVAADRRGYDGPIQLTIPNLLQGIHVEGGMIPREYVDAGNARTINRRGVLTITADPGVSLAAGELEVWGEGKLADGSVLRRRARGLGMAIDVAGATDQGVVDRQRALTAPWLGWDLPAALTDAPAAILEVHQTGMKQMAEGASYEFAYKWTVRGNATPPKQVGVDIVGAKDIRVIDMTASPMRNAMLAWSADSGKTWSSSRRVNSIVEAVQGEENGPKVAFSADKRAYVVWSIPGIKGYKTRANIRFAMDDGKGGFTPARTLNEVQDAARFPIIETTPDGNLLVAWIDRRIDGPKPRQLYLIRLKTDGQALTKNYQVGEGLCECCKLGIAFADGGKTVYMVDREVDGNKIRNHVLRKSTDGAQSFGAPVEINNDGWQVPSFPHSGPSIGRDSRGQLHVSWFTLGRSEQEAGSRSGPTSAAGPSCWRFVPTARRLAGGSILAGTPASRWSSARFPRGR